MRARCGRAARHARDEERRREPPAEEFEPMDRLRQDRSPAARDARSDRRRSRVDALRADVALDVDSEVLRLSRRRRVLRPLVAQRSGRLLRKLRDRRARHDGRSAATACCAASRACSVRGAQPCPTSARRAQRTRDRSSGAPDDYAPACSAAAVSTALAVAPSSAPSRSPRAPLAPTSRAACSRRCGIRDVAREACETPPRRARRRR